MVRMTSVIFALIISTIASAQSPLPVCKTCPTIEQITAPGVGFALEMGYGTAVIKFHNGTSQPVARIEGSSQYKDLLRDLAYGPQKRAWHNMRTVRVKILYLLSRLRRLLNKQLGLPADRQTAILAEMLSQLKAESESFLEHNSHISRAVLSSLDAAILSTEEISDVFDYLQMQNLMVQPDGRYRFYDASAAYAGFNRGLCQSYTKPYECQEEELKFSSEVLLHLDFSDAALSMTRIKLTKAMNWGPTRAFVIPDLGFAAVEQRKQALFEEIGERIRIFVQNYIPQITSLILTGTAASDQRFVDAVKGALLDLISVETMESFIIHVNTASDTDLIFATAKGAAEVAKRSQEGPVRCEWSDGCKKTLAQIRNYTNVERLEL